MAVHLVKSKLFRADFTDLTTTQSVATVNFEVDLRSVPGCEKSAKLCSTLKNCFDPSSQNEISVKLTVNRRNGSNRLIHEGQLGPYFDVDVGKNPLTMRVEVGGPVFEVGWLKNYKEPVQIKVELEFPKYEEEFKLVSKELRLPLDIDKKGYYPVEEQVELLWSKFYVGPGTYADGILTIKLVEAKRHSFTDVVVTNKRILDDKIQCDFALIAENGKFISCHKIFLACHSKVFRRMLETDCKETKEKACQMSVTEAAVNALLKFLYYSDLEEAFSSSSISLELLQTAHKYDIPSLEKAVKSILLEKSSDWYDLEVVLLLFQYALKVEGYEDLKMKAVKVINSKPYELRASTAYEDLFQKDAESGKELFLLCLNKGD